MQRRRALAVLAILLGGAGWWVVSASTPEARLERQLRRVVSDLASVPQETETERRERVKSVLESALADDVTGAWDGRVVVGRARLLGEVQALLVGREHAVLEVDALRIRVTGDQATVETELSLSEAQRGDLHRQRRQGRLTLTRLDGRWRLLQLDLGGVSRDEPEARP